MKTVKTNRKKWLMTSALMLSLGTSSFIFKSTALEGSFDLMSIQDDDAYIDTKTIDVGTAEGIMPVKLERIKSDPTKVLALVPQMTEGKVCNNCDLTPIILNHQFSDDLAAISASILKVQSEKQFQQADAKISVDKDDEDNGGELNPILEALLDKCDSSRNDDSRLNCLKNGFLKAMKANKGSERSRRSRNQEVANDKLPADEAFDFYKEYIESELINKISRSRQALMSERDSYMNENANDYVSYDSDPQAALQDSLDFVSDFLRETPSRYTSIRDSLLTAQKRIMQFENRQFNELKQMAASAPAGSWEALNYQQQAVARQQDMYGLWNNLQGINSSSLQDARADGNITSSQYMAYLAATNRLGSDIQTMFTTPLSQKYQTDRSYLTGMEQRLLEASRRSNGVVILPDGSMTTRTQNFQTLPNSPVQQQIPNLQNRLTPIRGF